MRRKVKIVSEVCLNGGCFYLWSSITLLDFWPSELAARFVTGFKMIPSFCDILKRFFY